jgi:3-phosphoshikimate 1-carboxyvinyltransferase
VDHVLPVASAQVKSALLLAGLSCGVSVREPARSRDHTERMLRAMGADLEERDGALVLSPTAALDPVDVDVPGDLSAAAFLLVAASLVRGSEVTIEGVGVNPTRTGVLDVLQAMGADVELRPRRSDPEPIADLVVRAAPLRATDIAGELALRSLDELVVLAVAAAFAEGTTRIRDAAELRVKESDRVARVAAGLRSLGVEVVEHPDGLDVTGGRPRGPARIDATGDHRLAMAFAVAGLVARDVEVAGADSVRSSWPSFADDLDRLR